MTPKFHDYFFIFQQSIDIFNKKCECQEVAASITFKQSFNTKKKINNDLWKATFHSEVFGNQKFHGSFEKISELVIIFIERMTFQIIESCSANFDDWYKNKPEVKNELYNLYAKITSLGKV